MKRFVSLVAAIVVVMMFTVPTVIADGSASEEAVPVTLFYVTTLSENSDSDLVKEYVKEKFGIELVPTFAYDNWQQKYSLLLASGQIPDLTVLPISNFYEYAIEGAYMDITDLVGDYPGIMAYVGELWPRLSVDGVVYGLPNKNISGKYNFYYRKDWLDKLGLEEPVTQDQFVEMLRAFTEDDPDGNGEDDTYGFAMYSTGSGPSSMEMFYGMFGAAPGFYMDQDGVVEIGDISLGYKDMLAFVKSLIDSGYIDPESFTQTSDQKWQKFLRGGFGASVGWWGDYAFAYLAYNMDETQPDAVLQLGDPVIGKTGLSGMKAYDPLSVVCAIGKDAENVDKILAFAEWAMSDEGYRTLKYGIKGLYYDTDDEGNLTYYWGHNDNKRMDEQTVENVTEVFSIFQRLDIYQERSAASRNRCRCRWKRLSRLRPTRSSKTLSWGSRPTCIRKRWPTSSAMCTICR